MNIACKEKKEFTLSLNLDESEAVAFQTLLHQATEDLMLEDTQLAIANDILAVFRTVG